MRRDVALLACLCAQQRYLNIKSVSWQMLRNISSRGESIIRLRYS
ncbi:hypothetical protein BC2230_40745 [Burkholderia cepacia]